MNNEKKIEIPAMPEKYRLMLEMLPGEPKGSKEEQAVRWKLRSTILEAYSAELRGKDVGGGVAILALLTGIMTEEAKKREDEKPKQGAEETANPAEGECINEEGMRKFQAKDAESGKCRRELLDAECEWCNLIPELVNSAAEKEAWTRLVTADERMRRTRSQLRRAAKIAMGYIAE
jgi:hypothetical protein